MISMTMYVIINIVVCVTPPSATLSSLTTYVTNTYSVYTAN